MKPDNNILKNIELRDLVLKSVRKFFAENNFREVLTPVRIKSPALEDFIDAIESEDQYLRTSPELHMKRMLCAGAQRIFQIGPCFRKGEKGHLHNPEFTMLEWYRADAGYLDILLDTRRMISAIAKEVTGSNSVTYKGKQINLAGPWDCITVSDAFLEHAGWDPLKEYDQDRFDMDLVSKVEPALPIERPVVLKDYPVEAAALAKCVKGVSAYAERWELYIGGLEIANAFSELTDAVEQKKRFEECAEFRMRNNKPVYPIDSKFLDAMERGMPESSGIALGLDRLIMILANACDISEILFD